MELTEQQQKQLDKKTQQIASFILEVKRGHMSVLEATGQILKLVEIKDDDQGISKYHSIAKNGVECLYTRAQIDRVNFVKVIPKGD